LADKEVCALYFAFTTDTLVEGADAGALYVKAATDALVSSEAYATMNARQAVIIKDLLGEFAETNEWKEDAASQQTRLLCRVRKPVVTTRIWTFMDDVC
jgi:hypothetical protein